MIFILLLLLLIVPYFLFLSPYKQIVPCSSQSYKSFQSEIECYSPFSNDVQLLTSAGTISNLKLWIGEHEETKADTEEKKENPLETYPSIDEEDCNVLMKIDMFLQYNSKTFTSVLKKPIVVDSSYLHTNYSSWDLDSLLKKKLNVSSNSILVIKRTYLHNEVKLPTLISFDVVN